VNGTPGIAAHGTTPGYQFDIVRPQEEPGSAGKIVWAAVVIAIVLILAYAVRMMR
jgi:hypothetical protein